MYKEPYRKLKGFFVANDIKSADVAKLLDVSLSTFYRKINRTDSDFTVPEVALLCKTYSLDANEFFLQLPFRNGNESEEEKKKGDTNVK